MTQIGSKRFIVGVALLVGVVSAFCVYLGVQTLGSGDFVRSFMYIGAGVGAFLVAGYQLFKTRKTSTDNSDSIEVHTTLECTQCTKKTERLFERGDYVYKNISPCTDCSGQMVITKIIVPEDPVIGG